jgi:hypothetical protein
LEQGCTVHSAARRALLFLALIFFVLGFVAVVPATAADFSGLQGASGLGGLKTTENFKTTLTALSTTQKTGSIAEIPRLPKPDPQTYKNQAGGSVSPFGDNQKTIISAVCEDCEDDISISGDIDPFESEYPFECSCPFCEFDEDAACPCSCGSPIQGQTGLMIAEFSADVRSGEAPLTVRFYDRSSGNIDTWSWDFGDGLTSDVRYPIHTYTQPGSYTVTLTISKEYGNGLAMESRTTGKDNYIQVGGEMLQPVSDQQFPATNFIKEALEKTKKPSVSPYQKTSMSLGIG